MDFATHQEPASGPRAGNNASKSNRNRFNDHTIGDSFTGGRLSTCASHGLAIVASRTSAPVDRPLRAIFQLHTRCSRSKACYGNTRGWLCGRLPARINVNALLDVRHMTFAITTTPGDDRSMHAPMSRMYRRTHEDAGSTRIDSVHDRHGNNRSLGRL